MTVGGQLLQKYAMHFGTFMGIYWILRFILFPLGLVIPFLFFLYLGLSVGVPFMGYYYVRMYRNKICGGFIKFNHAWFFALLMFLFASVLTSAAHFIYFRFIDGGHIINTYQQYINTMNEVDFVEANVNIIQIKELLDLFSTLTPIDITLQLLSVNVVFGAILSFIIALFVRRKPNTFLKL